MTIEAEDFECAIRRLSDAAREWLVERQLPPRPADLLSPSEDELKRQIRADRAYCAVNSPIGDGEIFEQYLKRRYALLEAAVRQPDTGALDRHEEQSLLLAKADMNYKLRVLRTPFEKLPNDDMRRTLREIRAEARTSPPPPPPPFLSKSPELTAANVRPVGFRSLPGQQGYGYVSATNGDETPVERSSPLAEVHSMAAGSRTVVAELEIMDALTIRSSAARRSLRHGVNANRDLAQSVSPVGPSTPANASTEEAEMGFISALPISNGNAVVEGSIEQAIQKSAPHRSKAVSQTATGTSGVEPGRRRPSRERATMALKALYPSKIPDQDSEPNKILGRKVSDWLKEKKLLEVKIDTILRAAGRRK